MGIIAWIVVGAIAGFIATLIMGNREGIVMTIVLGIIGAVVGGFLAGALLDLKGPPVSTSRPSSCPSSARSSWSSLPTSCWAGTVATARFDRLGPQRVSRIPATGTQHEGVSHD